MPGQFINRGTNPFGKVTLTNNFNTGNLNFSIATSIYTIGQAALGGIIAYINGGGSTGTSGLVVMSTDLSTGAEWGCISVDIVGTSASIGTGAANTSLITTGCATAGIAARLCEDLTEGGYSDWYLPSQDELNALYTNRVAIGGFTDAFYWSSTQVTVKGVPNSARTQNLSTGVVVATSKSNTSQYVRAIRSF